MLCFNLSFGQNNSNGSLISTLANSNLLNPTAPLPQTAEAFRFRPGLITQLDDPANQNFGFINSRWFSIGRLNTASQTVYGLRFQERNKAVVFGYEDINNPNPRIQWIGTGSGLGNFEFRVANSFNSTVSTLVATMNADGSTVFGALPTTSSIAKVRIINTTTLAASEGLNIQTNSNSSNSVGARISTTASARSIGLVVNATSNDVSTGILSTAGGSSQTSAIGVRGTVAGTNTFQAGIYGESAPTSNSLQWAGYFDGSVLVTGALTVFANQRLAANIKPQTTVLDKLEALNPITFEYNKTSDINLPSGAQHGFLEEELTKVYPELTTTTQKPIFDKEGNVTSFMDIPAVNYNGMISILTSGIKELHQEIKILKEELAVLRSDKAATQFNTIETANAGVFMKQNFPNPFTDSTTISYQLPEGTTTADIMVFDFNGKPIKTFPINKNESEITISAAEIGKGLFIYSLVQNGQELVTKKMIVN